MNPTTRRELTKFKKATQATLKMALNIMSVKEGSGAKDSIEYVYEWLWSCCQCGVHAAMSVDATLGCPSCCSLRCEYCPLEQVKLLSRMKETLHRPTTPKITSTSKEVTTSATSAVVQAHTIDALQIKRPAATLEEFEAQVTNVWDFCSQAVLE